MGKQQQEEEGWRKVGEKNTKGGSRLLCAGASWRRPVPRAALRRSQHGAPTCSPFDAVPAASGCLFLWPPAWVPALGPRFNSCTFLSSVGTLSMSAARGRGSPAGPVLTLPLVGPPAPVRDACGHCAVLQGPASVSQPWPLGPSKLDPAVEGVDFLAAGIGRSLMSVRYTHWSAACSPRNHRAWGCESRLRTDGAPSSTPHAGLKMWFKFCL